MSNYFTCGHKLLIILIIAALQIPKMTLTIESSEPQQLLATRRPHLYRISKLSVISRRKK